MTLIVFMQNMHVLNCRSEKQSTFKVSLKTNPLIIFSILGAIFLQIIFSEIPYLSKFLQTTSIPIIHMLILFALSTIIIFIMEIYKAIKRKIQNKKLRLQFLILTLCIVYSRKNKSIYYQKYCKDKTRERRKTYEKLQNKFTK